MIVTVVKQVFGSSVCVSVRGQIGVCEYKIAVTPSHSLQMHIVSVVTRYSNLVRYTERSGSTQSVVGKCIWKVMSSCLLCAHGCLEGEVLVLVLHNRNCSLGLTVWFNMFYVHIVFH